MNKKSLKNFILVLGATVLFLSSCEKNDPEPDITAGNLKGMFVVCEGVYGQANGDISFYDSETGTSVVSLFEAVNGVKPGDVVQSFEIVDTLGFILVNNSQKVIVVNMKDFKVIKTINGFSYPRSLVRADDNTVYVSNGNGTASNYIYSIDLLHLEKTDSLEVTGGPEKLIYLNMKVYAAIPGGWNNDGNSVIGINPSTFSITDTYEVASVPVDLVADKDANIWAYCKGIPDYSNYPDVTYTDSGISKIKVSTGEVTTFSLPGMITRGINNIAASPDGSIIYYLGKGLYSIEAGAVQLPSSKLFDRVFYGMDVDPQSGNIVCLDDVSSKAVVLDPTGAEQYSFETAAFPNSVVFSYL
ncbi:MAG: hypothetical protein KFF49_12755 [Bacteroidales bacterium]|nr:hypothetical protein [Bacteroidales bacterium]